MTNHTSKPTILFIDDDQDSPGPLASALRLRDVSCAVRSPADLLPKDIESAQLILIDHDLKLPASPVVWQTIADGVALAAVLRRQFLSRDAKSPPIGFAILSGKLDQLAHPLPASQRHPQLARQHNLEWVFAKDEPSLATSVEALARAVARIPSEWANGIDGLSELAGPLAIDPSASDADTCIDRLERCCPPIADFSQWTHGLAFVRWMLQSILPFPSFLIDLRHLALRWRMEYTQFSEAFNREERLRKYFAEAAYTGMLADFDGPRWWSHRIDRKAWEATRGDSLDPGALATALRQATELNLPTVAFGDPVVCYDENLKPADNFFESAECCRVRPDGWPPYAEPPWMTFELLRDQPKLRYIVHPDDVDRLKKSAS